MKYELKIEYKNQEILDRVIMKSYFENENNGKLVGKKDCIKIGQDDILFIAFKGLNNITIKLTNEDLIDGSMRCVVDETSDSVSLYPINNYCIVEDKKYSFY